MKKSMPPMMKKKMMEKAKGSMPMSARTDKNPFAKSKAPMKKK